MREETERGGRGERGRERERETETERQRERKRIRKQKFYILSTVQGHLRTTETRDREQR